MNIVQVTHQFLQAMLQNSYDTMTSLFVHGTFGIGKSYAVKEFGKKKAKEMVLEYSENPGDINDEGKFIVLVIPLHQYDASELKGIPIPSEDRKSTIFLPTGQLPAKGQGIIFFDELNLAPPLVQANAYQLILDRRLGSYSLPKGYVAMAAGNTSDDRAHNFEMAMPLKNRFRHCQLMVPSAEEWVNDFAIPNRVDPRIIGFLVFRGDRLYVFNPDSSEEVMAVPTPRTWEMTSKSIKNIEDENLLSLFVGSNVGVGVAGEFMAYIALSVSYDIEKIFKDKKLPKKPTELSEIYSLISALTFHYSKMVKRADGKDKVKIAEAAETVLDLSEEFKVEHKILMLNLAKSVDDNYFKRLSAHCHDKFKKVAESSIKFLI